MLSVNNWVIGPSSFVNNGWVRHWAGPAVRVVTNNWAQLPVRVIGHWARHWVITGSFTVRWVSFNNVTCQWVGSLLPGLGQSRHVAWHCHWVQLATVFNQYWLNVSGLANWATGLSLSVRHSPILGWVRWVWVGSLGPSSIGHCYCPSFHVRH